MSRSGTRFTFEIDGLPAETFTVMDFHLSQSYSSLFALNVTLASAEQAIPFEDILDETGVLTIWQGEQPQRRVKGVVTCCEQGDTGKHQTVYQLSVRPFLWRSSQRRNCRSFQNTDPKGIISKLLTEMDIGGHDEMFRSPHPQREFCVQFMETDYAFISRLVAEEGIFFYEQENLEGDDQQLVFADDRAGLQMLEPLPFNPNAASEAETYCINYFRRNAQISPAKATTKDYTFTAPNWQAEYQQVPERMPYQRPDYEFFDYPGRFKDEQHGADFARYQLDGWRNEVDFVVGASNSPQLQPGVCFPLTDHPRDDLNDCWQVISIDMHGEQPQALIGQGGQGTTLNTRFKAIPWSQTWRPEPLPKPRVDGPQIAFVTGPEGEEIYCDKHGRVRVKFAWDRYNNADQSSSCWVRVSQAWAGTGFGNIAIPRVGQEVIVDFLNGDPDQPIITGRTYHATNLAPGNLPATKTQMAIRTKTYKGDGFNELRFEDAPSQEEVYIHAEKDMNHIINNDRTSLTKRHSVDKVQGNSATLVTQNNVVHVDGTQNTFVGGNCVWSVGKAFGDGFRNMDLSKYHDGAAYHLKNLAFSAGVHGIVPGSGNMILRVEGSRTEHVNMTDTSSTLGAKTVNAGGIITLNAGTMMNLFSGENSKEVCRGTKIIKASENIEFHAGASSICLGKDGHISIRGLSISIEGSEVIILKSQKIEIEG